MVFLIHEAIHAEMSSFNLPKTVDAWSRSDPPKIIDSAGIFKYMNGAGELYIGYRFDHLEVFNYTSENQDDILVELYFMETTDDAFGLLSLDWGGEPVSFHTTAERKSPSTPDGSIRALYGAGLLRIWTDNIYARIMASRETPALRRAVLDLGRIVAEDRNRPPEPELIKSLPAYVQPGWKIRHDRLSYFRSYLVLNSIYYISNENILDMDHSTEAVMAPYECDSGSGERGRPRLLLIKYETQEKAREALDHFHRAYLTEYKDRLPGDSASKTQDIFKVEDGWVGYRLTGSFAVSVFESPDSKTVKLLLEKTVSGLIKKGG
jgi:hypothetical protein